MKSLLFTSICYYVLHAHWVSSTSKICESFIQISQSTTVDWFAPNKKLLLYTKVIIVWDKESFEFRTTMTLTKCVFPCWETPLKCYIHNVIIRNWDITVVIKKRLVLPIRTQIMNIYNNKYHNICCRKFSKLL